MQSLSKLSGFIPFDIRFKNSVSKLKWCSLNKIVIKEPFFDNDIQRHIYNGELEILETDLYELLLSKDVIVGLKPSGFIFHMSRCGSTLISNVIGKSSKNISISEPDIIDKLINLSNGENENYVLELVGCAINALGQKRMGSEENYVIKFPSYATLSIPYLKKIYPEVPRIFLYRDPIEVLVSNLKQPWQSWIYEESVTGRDSSEILEINSALKNCAYALSNKCSAFLKSYDNNCLIINYNQISPDLIIRILDFFNISYSQLQLEEMLFELGADSKRGKQFQQDSHVKQKLASARLQEVANEILMPIYEKLEKLRISL